MASDYSALRKLNELVRDIRVAMMTTIREDGTPHSRPMATQHMEIDGDLWFLTAWHTDKVHELEERPMANLAYMNPEKNTYVSVSGTAALVRDPAKARELWNPLYRAWFPKGLDDPDLALIKVAVEHVEYWDAPSSTMVQVAGLVKSAVTGKPYEIDHGELELRGTHHG